MHKKTSVISNSPFNKQDGTHKVAESNQFDLSVSCIFFKLFRRTRETTHWLDV